MDTFVSLILQMRTLRHREVVSPVWGHDWWPRTQAVNFHAALPPRWAPEALETAKNKQAGVRVSWDKQSRMDGAGPPCEWNSMKSPVLNPRDELRIFLLPWTLPGWGQKKKSWVRKSQYRSCWWRLQAQLSRLRPRAGIVLWPPVSWVASGTGQRGWAAGAQMGAARPGNGERFSIKTFPVVSGWQPVRAGVSIRFCWLWPVFW